jgi:hypothetical protein
MAGGADNYKYGRLVSGGASVMTTPVADGKVSADSVIPGVFDPEEGDVRSGTSTKYYKTYLYYSGSIIDRTAYSQYGYQDNFNWSDHVYVYANQTTTYEVENVYTKTGEINHTIVGLGGSLSSNTTDVYDWVSRETTPSVEVVQNTEGLYILPSSVGILSETDRYIYPGASSVGDSDGFDSHTYEETFTDNSIPTHEHYEHTEEEVASETYTDIMITYISSAETAFINDQFKATAGMTTSEFMTAQIDKYALQIYNSSMIAKNIFAINKTKEIRQKNLREIPNIEPAFSASINTNLSDGISSTALPEDTSVEESESSSDGFGMYGSGT